MKIAQALSAQSHQPVLLPSTQFSRSLGPSPDGLLVLDMPLISEAWKAYVRMTPQEFYDRLTRDLPYQTTLSFNVNVDGTGYLKFSIKDGVREVAYAHRCFSITNSIAWNHGFAIWKPEDRGPGLGICRCIMRNVFDLYQSWGIKRIECDASLEDGAYTWARYGFKVAPAEWPDLQAQLLDRLYTLPVPWQDNDAYARLIGLDDPGVLWTVSDLATPIEVNDAVTGERRTLGLGRALLRGLSWKGVFDAGDPDCMARFERKVGEVRNG